MISLISHSACTDLHIRPDERWDFGYLHVFKCRQSKVIDLQKRAILFYFDTREISWSIQIFWDVSLSFRFLRSFLGRAIYAPSSPLVWSFTIDNVVRKLLLEPQSLCSLKLSILVGIASFRVGRINLQLEILRYTVYCSRSMEAMLLSCHVVLQLLVQRYLLLWLTQSEHQCPLMHSYPNVSIFVQCHRTKNCSHFKWVYMHYLRCAVVSTY